MKSSYIFLSDCFEDIEAIAVIDILRRAEIPIVSISMNSTRSVVSSHGVAVEADALFGEVDFSQADYVILPGGSTKLNDYESLKELLVRHTQQGGRVAAICAAPMVLGGLSLLDGKRATCYPGFEQYLAGAELIDSPVVVDGSTITANGPAAALAFSYALVEAITSKEMAEKLQSQMQY